MLKRSLFALFSILILIMGAPAQAAHLHYGWQKVDGLNLFYREGGRPDAPTILFLHGNPLSSIMYDEVMRNLLDSQDVHVLAVDYPSFGYSDAPDRKAYAYTFDHIAETVRDFLRAKGVSHYAMYMQDYGVPVGFRLATADPQAITAIIVQNGVIHLDGFPAAQDPNGELRQHWLHRNPNVDARRIAYTAAQKFPGPDNWEYGPDMAPDSILLMITNAQRPGIIEARNDLWFDYGNNVKRYPAWQALLRKLNVPVLVLWGDRDDFFTYPGAVAYLRDAPKAEVHIFDGDHFASLQQPDIVSPLLASFLARHRDALLSLSPAKP